jgi:hypothetical protein
MRVIAAQTKSHDLRAKPLGSDLLLFAFFDRGHVPVAAIVDQDVDPAEPCVPFTALAIWPPSLTSRPSASARSSAPGIRSGTRAWQVRARNRSSIL